VRSSLCFCRRFGSRGQKLAKKLEFQQFEPEHPGGKGACAKPCSCAHAEQSEQVVCEPLARAQSGSDSEPVQFDVFQPQLQPAYTEPEQFEQVISEPGAYSEPVHPHPVDAESIEHDNFEPIRSEPEQ